MNKNVKFGLLAAIILGTLGWLAAGRDQDTQQIDHAVYYSAGLSLIMTLGVAPGCVRLVKRVGNVRMLPG